MTPKENMDIPYAQKRIASAIDHLFTLAEEWEEAPAKKQMEEYMVNLSRFIFYEGALYGYANGLGNKTINIELEMDKRGYLSTIKIENEADNTDNRR